MKNILREYYKIWKANKTEEELQKYKFVNYKQHCDICDKTYSNIYQHRMTKKHKLNTVPILL
jgi:hypothetical protein